MTPAQVQAAYVRALTTVAGPGETVQIVRQGDGGSYSVHARVTEFVPQDLAGAVQQGRRSAIVLASDVAASGFPLPFKPESDRLVWGGKSNVIGKVDDATARIQGQTIAYMLDLDGA